MGNELVVDTSVVLKFCAPEPDSDNVLSVKRRRGELTELEAEDKGRTGRTIADLLPLSHWMQLVPLRTLSLEAL